MLSEWMLIALPLIFALGWFGARLDIRQIRKNAGELPRAYWRGLSHLLDGNNEKALDALSDAEKITSDPTTAADVPVDVQFAIGALSRRRGDFKRACCTHLDLYNCEKLTPDERNRALLELAKDYSQMGFVDLAEEHALPLLRHEKHPDQTKYHDKAFALLLQIYQRRRLYEQALALIEEHTTPAQAPLQRHTAAQLYCERAHSLADTTEQYRLLEKALLTNPQCARANLMLGELALASGDNKTAQQRFKAVEMQHPAYLWLVVPGYLRADETGGRQEVMRWLDDYPSPQLFQTVCDAFAGTGVDIDDLIDRYLSKHNDVIAATYWAERQSAKGMHPAWLKVKAILQRTAGKAFTCNDCDFEFNHFSWECRGCLKWETLAERKR